MFIFKLIGLLFFLLLVNFSGKGDAVGKCHTLILTENHISIDVSAELTRTPTNGKSRRPESIFYT